MRTLFILTFLLAWWPAQASASTTRLSAGPGSSVVLAGSSNVKDWKCRSTSVDAQMAVATSPDHLNEVIDRVEDGSIGVWMNDRSKARLPMPQFQLRIPVTTFRCGNSVMESDLRRAMKSESHPDVSFSLRGLKSGIRHDLNNGIYRARVEGELSLAGVRRIIDVEVAVRRVSRKRFRVSAELPLKMTDFGISPPTALFGAVRARDQLTVRFDLMLEIDPV